MDFIQIRYPEGFEYCDRDIQHILTMMIGRNAPTDDTNTFYFRKAIKENRDNMHPYDSNWLIYYEMLVALDPERLAKLMDAL